MKRQPFTPEEEKFLRDNRLKMPSRKLAEHLGCSKTKVQCYFRKHNITIPRELAIRFRAEALKGRTSFTPEMDKVLIENCLTMPIKPLGEKIGKSWTGISVRLRQLGLEIPKELRQQRKKIGQLKRGNVPANKGKKQHEFMTPEAIERTKGTRFKKGQVPPNTKWDGYQRISKDGYIEERVSRGKFMHKHVVIWEQHHGKKVPKGHCVVFEDGNNRNFEPSNLKLLSRAENMLRNSVQNYPKEVRQVIHMTGVLKRKLNSKLKENEKRD